MSGHAMRLSWQGHDLVDGEHENAAIYCCGPGAMVDAILDMPDRTHHADDRGPHQNSHYRVSSCAAGYGHGGPARPSSHTGAGTRAHGAAATNQGGFAASCMRI